MKYVLITQREQIDKYGVPIDILESVYINFFEKIGLCPLPVSNFMANPQELFALRDVAVVVLTGGGSLPEGYYTEANGYEVQGNRDLTEKVLLEEAVKRGIPVLAICRGMQFVNGYFGGKISRFQNLKRTRAIGKDHLVTLFGEEVLVNNYHNDGIYVENLAKSLDIICEDVENKVVEGYYSREKKILGLQWHPERSFSDAEGQRKTAFLVKNFIEGGGKL